MIENTFGMNIIPENDSERLSALERYRIMDTPSEASFDNIAKLCTKIFDVPISLISLVDAERVFFKANVGMGKAREADRGKSLCALAVLSPEVTVFKDALKEPCLTANPSVADDFGLRFYAAAPLISQDGFRIGSICIMDRKAREFSDVEREILSGMATVVMDQIELRIPFWGAGEVKARRTEDELNERLKIAMDASKLGSTEVELATGIMQSTDQFKANYGYDKDEVFNYPDLFNAMLPEYREPVKALVQEAIATNGIYKTEYPIKWRDGSIHWISAHGRPRYDAQGKVTSMVGMTADITESKLFEQRKDDFLSIASHELKTPITSLKASLQLLNRIKEKPTSATHIKLVDQANRSMERMSELVDDLLNMNRMADGQLKLNKTRFNVSELLNNCCNHVRIDDKFKLIVEGDQDLQIYADEHRIDQVVINFVNNAVKYAPDSKEIFLRVEKLGNCAKVSVRDKGPGIEKHILPNLFDRYYRVSYEGQTYTGLGLGLYICSEIIKRHGGQIGAESELHVGSVFWFTVPI